MPRKTNSRQSKYNPSNMNWCLYDHMADMGIQGQGANPETAFANAVLALNAIVTDLDVISPDMVLTVTCQEQDLELLFFDFINEVIFLISSRKMLFSRARVRINGPHLKAWLYGQRIDPDKHDPAVEIKGASFNGLMVQPNEQGVWVARCIVDV